MPRTRTSPPPRCSPRSADTRTASTSWWVGWLGLVVSSDSFKVFYLILLLQVVAGADVTRKNINDDSAYSLAVKHGARAVQTVLENHMLAIISGGGAGGGAGGGPVQRI